MGMSKQQKRERALQVHALGMQGSDALKAVIEDLAELGETSLVRCLRVRLFELRRDVARRCNELEHEGLTAAQRDNAALLQSIKRSRESERRQPVRLREVLDAG
jgi:hypothetical protein